MPRLHLYFLPILLAATAIGAFGQGDTGSLTISTSPCNAILVSARYCR